MIQDQVVGVSVRDQHEALAFHVDELGLSAHTDARNGNAAGSPRPRHVRGRG